MVYYIYTDGAARGNPGPSASGYQIFDSSHKMLIKESIFNGRKTNNFAEYFAVINALERISKEYGFGIEVHLYSDSELVVHQLMGHWKIKDAKLKALNLTARELIRKFKQFNAENVPRSNRYITAVDRELNLLLDRVKNNKDTDSKQEDGGTQRRL